MKGIVILVRLIDGAKPLEIKEKGDWIDLCANENVEISSIRSGSESAYIEDNLIKLGVAMKLPEGYEAIIAPRSSTYKTYGVMQWNSIGVIDHSYCGTNDEWMFGCIALKDRTIHKGDRICQFRIQLSQKATIWQKIKWLFTSGKITFKYVDSLSDTDRKGFGKGTGAR